MNLAYKFSEQATRDCQGRKQRNVDYNIKSRERCFKRIGTGLQGEAKEQKEIVSFSLSYRDLFYGVGVEEGLVGGQAKKVWF